MMRLPILIALLALIVPLWNSAAASADTSYPLTCEIGTMNPIGFTGGSVNIAEIQFSRSTGAVVAGLQPGQCAYSDRAVKPSEPNALCFSAGLAALALQGSKALTTSFTGPGAAALQTAVLGPTKLMNFTVHQSGGCLQVDHFGV